MNSRQLEDCFSRDRIRISAESFDTTPVGQETVMRLQEWSQGHGSPLLWLEGPVLELDDLENPFTGIAAKFIRLAEIHNLTVISHFCELPRRTTGKHGPEETAAISLLYAILRQLIEVLPPCLETTIDFSEDRFARLDGTMDTWSEATACLRDLSSVMSRVVFCVIDGLHWLDSRRTEMPLVELLRIFRTEGLRVLFTTSGRSGCLLDDLEREEICSLQDLSPGRFGQDLEW